MFETEERTSKSDRTRARISAAAINSFMTRGYTDTTMRSIAEKAGVSVGNAYYYFPSKEHLVQALYEQVQREHERLARERLEGVTTLVDRLRVVYLSGLDALAPYRAVAPGFLTAMVPPGSPLNPLSTESSLARDMTIRLFRDVVDGAQHRLPDDVVAPLPEALLVGHLAVVLRWTYDQSPEQAKTRALLTSGLRLLALALPFVRVPEVHSAVRELLVQVAEVRS